MRLIKDTMETSLPTDLRLIPSDRNRSFSEFNEILDMIGEDLQNGKRSRAINIDMQVTEDCNLRCTYCFQVNKSKERLRWEDAKAFIDYILTRTEENCEYINPTKYHAVVFGFVGGDALLEIDLIDRVLTYFVERMIELNHPWLSRWAAHLDTNGILYFDPRVQKFLDKWPSAVSCTITLDGNEALHDKCRVFPDGSGSYKYAVAAINDQFKRGQEPAGKFTVSHDNIEFLYDAVINLVNLGYTYILGNEVFEDVWEDGDFRKYFDQLIKLADYFLEHKYYKSIEFPLLEICKFDKMDSKLNDNICGGNGEMLNLSVDGKLYNCYRYNRTSVYPKEPIDIGDPYHGIGYTEKQRRNVMKLHSMTRLTCSDIECLNCPIGLNCSYCNGCNYCSTGDPGRRTKFNCLMHCASYLASVYYWNASYKKEGSNYRYSLIIPKDKALQILTEEEYDKLKKYCSEV